MDSLGIVCPSRQPPIILNYGSVKVMVDLAIQQAMDVYNAKLQLILMITPTRNSDSHDELKRISDSDAGLGFCSQCIVKKNFIKVHHGLDQILSNLSMKINMKLGGVNAIVHDLPHRVSEQRTMIIGVDVNHPNSRDTMEPSIAAVVGSMDNSFTRYSATFQPQGHGVEMIEGLQGMVRTLLEQFRAARDALPTQIVFFQDGVSEGQFQMALIHELTAIRDACKAFEIQPAITFVVVQKRHHTRFFPTDQRDADKSGNLKAGTVVDQGVCHPTEFDFFLQSHRGLIGTSRPSHYHVLWDEMNFTPDELQVLINSLCYTFVRATRAVSIVPPVYYADLLAYRARLFVQDHDESHESTSSVTSTGSTYPVLGIHPGVSNTMFFL